jgi:small subunit ribosomal protein S6
VCTLANIPEGGGAFVKSYELTIILRSGKVDEAKSACKDILSKYGATIQSEEDWGPKKLAYMIDGETEGFFLFTIIDAKPDSIKQIAKSFKLNNSILRHLFVVQNTKSVKEAS